MEKHANSRRLARHVWFWASKQVKEELFHMRYEFFPSTFRQLAAIIGPRKAAELENAHYKRKGTWTKLLPIRAEVAALTRRARGVLNYGNDTLIISALFLLDKIKRPLDDASRGQTRAIRAKIDAMQHANHVKQRMMALPVQKQAEGLLRFVRGVFIPNRLEDLLTIIDPQKAAEVAHAHYQQEGAGPMRIRLARCLKRLEALGPRSSMYLDEHFIPRMRELTELTHHVEQQGTRRAEDAVQALKRYLLDLEGKAPHGLTYQDEPLVPAIRHRMQKLMALPPDVEPPETTPFEDVVQPE